MTLVVAPRTKPRHWLATVIVLAVLGVLITAGVYTATVQPPAQAVLQVADAGPLRAHYQTIAGKQVAVCDSSNAVASNDGRQGVAGAVYMVGPAWIRVTVTGNARVRRAHQQITARDARVDFDFPLTAPATSIEVLAKVGGSTGTCFIAPPASLVGVHPGAMFSWAGTG